MAAKKAVAIIGAGASGLMAAIELGVLPGGTALLEGNDKPGKKLLATGNGRCNLTNRAILPGNYHGGAELAAPLISEWPGARVEEAFHRLGLLTRADSEGRVYPNSLQASAVLRALWSAVEETGVELICGFQVQSIQRIKPFGFRIISRDGREVLTERCILSCGGSASPQHAKSTSGSGYELAKSLGHSVTKLSPALTGLKSSAKFIHILKGTRCRVRAALCQRGKELYSESGEVIFGDGSISGICVMNLSSRLRGLPSGGLSLRLDLLEEMPQPELLAYLTGICAAHPDRQASELFFGAVNMRLGQEIVRAAGIDLGRKLSRLASDELERCALMCKSFALPVDGTLGWEHAQVTAGGVPMSQVGPMTLESMVCPGLYITGELLDVDGDCGGYNLHWAWVTGLTAARHIRDKAEVGKRC